MHGTTNIKFIEPDIYLLGCLCSR